MPKDSEKPDTIDNVLHHSQIPPKPEEANTHLLQTLAELEHCDITELPPLYDRIDHLIKEVFSDPPAKEAQVELNFSYHGYRIELDQNGYLTIINTSESRPK